LTEFAPANGVASTVTAGDLEQWPGPGGTLALGLQHVLVSNVWLDPVFVATVGGLSSFLAGNLVNTMFLAAGIVTLTQCTRMVKLPIVEGPSTAFDVLMIGFIRSGQLAMASTGILIAALALFVLAFSGLLSLVRRVFSPAVTGTVIILIGLTLASFTLQEFLGGDPTASSFASPQTLIISTVTLVAVLFPSAFGGGALRAYCFVWALLIGDLCSLAFGRLSLDAARAAPVFGVPQLLPYGPLQFDGGVTGAVSLAFVVAVIEAIGVYYAAGEIIGISIDDARLRLGVTGEAVGSFISALFGGFATTAYAQNVGLLKLTGVRSRFPVIAAGAIFLVLGFFPKLGVALAATPDPVIGGLFLPAAGSVLLTGVATLARASGSQRHGLVAGVALIAGTGLVPLSGTLQSRLPAAAAVLLSPLVVGTAAALVLEVVLVQVPWHRRDRSVSGSSGADPI
jgi:NCS2 family nucleobase:cation symporter-2